MLDKGTHQRIQTYANRIRKTNGFIIVDSTKSKSLGSTVTLMKLSKPLEIDMYDSSNEEGRNTLHDMNIMGDKGLLYEVKEGYLMTNSNADVRGNWGDILITGPDDELIEEFRNIVVGRQQLKKARDLSKKLEDTFGIPAETMYSKKLEDTSEKPSLDELNIAFPHEPIE
jgi:hypothetical protein